MKLVTTIPALPGHDIERAVTFYHDKLGFECAHKDDSFARLVRDAVEIHLWAACDTHWKFRSIILFVRPVSSGAESFLGGTASCTIKVEEIDKLYDECKKAGVLFGRDTIVEETSWGTREFPVLDPHRNLLTFYQSKH